MSLILYQDCDVVKITLTAPNKVKILLTLCTCGCDAAAERLRAAAVLLRSAAVRLRAAACGCGAAACGCGYYEKALIDLDGFT